MKRLLLLLVCTQAFAANTLYVATTGDDSRTYSQAMNVGTPWKTLTKAASQVLPGDTVQVAAGTYAENLWMTQAGSTYARITWVGAANYGSIIDPTIDASANWQLATGPGIEANVYTNKSFAWEPGMLKADGKNVVQIREDAARFIVYAFEDTRLVDGGVQYPGTFYWWDGIEAAWMWDAATSTAWLHFRGGAHPNTKSVRVSKGVVGKQMHNYQGGEVVRMASYNTLNGFHVRGAAWSIDIPYNCGYSIIENCKIEDGYHQVNMGQYQVTSAGCDGNIIRNNLISPNFYGFGGGAWNTYRGTAGWIRYRPYRYTKSYVSTSDVEAAAVFCENVGDNNVIHNNVFTNCSAGAGFGGHQPRLVTQDPGQGNIIASNYFYKTSGQSIWIGSAVDNMYVHDNVSEDSRFFLRVQGINFNRQYATRWYYYRNRGWNPDGYGTGLYTHIEQTLSQTYNDTELYVYHNSWEGTKEGWSTPGATVDYMSFTPFRRFMFVNNIINVTGGAPIVGPARVTTMRGWDYNRHRANIASVTYPWQGSHNVIDPNYEWGSGTTPPVAAPNFELLAGSVSISKGIPVHTTFGLLGVNYLALPGFSSIYYSGTSADIGAIPFDFDQPEPPDPGVITNILSISVVAPATLADAVGAASPLFTVSRAPRLEGGVLIPNTVGNCPYTVAVTSPDGAVAGVDFTVATTSGQINNGLSAETSKVFVTSLRNTAYTGQRIVRVTLQPGAAYDIAGTSYADVTLYDADTPPQVIVRPQPEPGHGILRGLP